jgi:hypothetical protein
MEFNFIYFYDLKMSFIFYHKTYFSNIVMS